MFDQPLVQLLLLLGAAIAVVWLFQRLRVPPVLGYLLVGVLLGPYTPGPVIEGHQLRLLAEYGIVFLLFTIGLNFSLPQIRALRHTVFWLGTAQVGLTTLVVGLLAWLVGIAPDVAFVLGAVFAQSSSTVISKQLEDQREEHSRHGRLALAMSVFQDVTAVPFVVVIPVLGQAASADGVALSLGWAMVKAALALTGVYLAGRWLMKPFFHAIASRRSPELFTLTVLFVSLAAAWVTSSLGLSMAFGAFLVGMMLGETEFRFQIESAIRPFRDVLLGLFFIGIGMLFDLSALPRIWHLALGGTLVLMVSKTLLVAPIVRLAGNELAFAWRCALLLAVGGEFGFALLAIAVESGVVTGRIKQVALMSVLISMILGPLVIRYSGVLSQLLASRVVRAPGSKVEPADTLATDSLAGHVILCGYGRVGHAIAALLAASEVPFLAYDTDLGRVAQGRADGHRVLYGDIADTGLFGAAQAQRAALILITIDDAEVALRAVTSLRRLYPTVPIIARAWNLEQSGRLLRAGATQAYPEAVEASLRLGAAVLEMVGASHDSVQELIQGVRDEDYAPVVEDGRGDSA